MGIILQHRDAFHDLLPFIQFKNVKKTHGGVLFLLKLQASTCNFAKGSILPWVFFQVF